MTVSRVINNSDYVKQETRERVEAAIVQLDYVPNRLGQSLRFKKTKTIALQMTELVNPFWLTVLQGVEEVASQSGFMVIVGNSNASSEKEMELLENFLSKQVDGVLLAPTRNPGPPLTFVKRQHVPIVVMDRQIPGATVDTVHSDSVSAAYRLTQYLLDIGHRRIGVLSGAKDVSTAVDRVTGFKKAQQEAGIPIDKSLIRYGQYSIESGYEMAGKMLAAKNRPSAILATNNALAVGTWQAIQEARLRIPDDISVVTFDFRRTAFFQMEAPFFTMAAFSGYDMGKRATELLLKRIHGEGSPAFEEIILPAEVVINRSTAPFTG